MTAATTLDEWADKYGELRAAGPGAPTAWIGIPLIVSSLIGMLWTIPVASALTDASPAINYATLFLMATFVYYCILSIALALGAFLFLLAATAPSIWLSLRGVPIAPLAVPIFLTVLIWHLLDTRRATGRLRIVRNLQYVMLGPIWLLRAVYRKLGVAV